MFIVKSESPEIMLHLLYNWVILRSQENIFAFYPRFEHDFSPQMNALLFYLATSTSPLFRHGFKFFCAVMYFLYFLLIVLDLI